MSWYGNRMPKFVKADSEGKLEKKLSALSIGMNEKVEVIAIYPRGSSVIAWYFLDIQKIVRQPIEQAEGEVPAKKKKRVTKKKKV